MTPTPIAGPWWAELGRRLELAPPTDPTPAKGGEAQPDAAWLAALLLLDGVGPARLLRLVAAYGPAGAWARVLAGSLGGRPDLAGPHALADWPALVARWQRTARGIDVAAVWAHHVEAGIGVASWGSASFPSCLLDDPEPPAVLFHRGDPALLAADRVAVVGTRRCSERGARFAEQLGFDLARAGVAVVSGLALGIDGAAHRGALRAAARCGAPPIGVVASGLDVVYPRRHASLWEAVASAGVLLSEVPLGVRPTRWRFPARNRILAGLADVVVVVETPEVGGSMHTVEEAVRRGVPVLAVPGAVGLRAGAGTNRLLHDGAGVVRDAGDVLVELGLLGPGHLRRVVDQREPPSPSGAAVLAGLGWRPTSLAELVDRLGLPVASVVAGVDELTGLGWIATSGAWLERVGP